jgi:arylformamidase
MWAMRTGEIALNKEIDMTISDITLTLSPNLPSWPGDPAVTLERVRKIEEGANANVSRLDMGVHNGTHVDAPVHFVPGEFGVDRLDLNILVGPALVVELPDEVDTITASVLQTTSIPSGTKRVLFKTRNSKIWANRESGFQTDFVGVEVDAAEYLVAIGIELVGVDYLSVAPFKRSRPTHEVLLKAKMIVVEGLDLSRIRPGLYTLYCLPLKIEGCDGAPARVILVS